MASFVIGPFATFDRPLQDEELPTLSRLDEWAIDMDLLPGRGGVELTTMLQSPRRITAPSLARRYQPIVRRDCG